MHTMNTNRKVWNLLDIDIVVFGHVNVNIFMHFLCTNMESDKGGFDAFVVNFVTKNRIGVIQINPNEYYKCVSQFVCNAFIHRL